MIAYERPERVPQSPRSLALVVVALTVAGCEQGRTPAQVAETEAKRVAADAAFLQKLAEPRVLQAGAHQIVVVEVPQLESGVLRSVQRCFVWRDAEFRTSTMSCPGANSDIRLTDER